MFGRKGLGRGASQGQGSSPEGASSSGASRGPSFPPSDVPPIIVEAMHWVYFVTVGADVTPEQSIPNFSAKGITVCFKGADQTPGRSIELNTAEGRAIGYIFPEFTSVMMWGQTRPRQAIPFEVVAERFPGFETEARRLLA